MLLASAQHYVFPAQSEKQHLKNPKQGQSLEALWHLVHVQRLLGQFTELNNTCLLVHNFLSFLITHIVKNIEYRLSRACLSGL